MCIHSCQLHIMIGASELDIIDPLTYWLLVEASGITQVTVFSSCSLATYNHWSMTNGDWALVVVMRPTNEPLHFALDTRESWWLSTTDWGPEPEMASGASYYKKLWYQTEQVTSNKSRTSPRCHQSAQSPHPALAPHSVHSTPHPTHSPTGRGRGESGQRRYDIRVPDQRKGG